MVLAGPAFLAELTPQQRDALHFFPSFPVLDFAQPPAEVVMAIGYMIPSQAPHRDVSLAFAELLASEAGRDLLATDVAAHTVTRRCPAASRIKPCPKACARASSLSRAPRRSPCPIT